MRDTGRVDPKEIVERLNEFTEPAKEGDKFGKSWDTHWFKIKVEIPDEWLSDEKEVHLLWNGKCEAALYNLDGSRLLQAFTENVRERYIIKRDGIKNDLLDPKVNIGGNNKEITYLLEMACNEMFGNFQKGFNSEVDMEKEFILEKCKIGFFNRIAWDLYFNFEILKDGAANFDKKDHHRAHDCLF